MVSTSPQSGASSNSFLEILGVIEYFIRFNYAVVRFGYICLLLLLFTKFYFITLIYIAWYVYDRNAPSRSDRFSYWCRNWSLFKHAARYFPLKLIKTEDLPSDRSYIFGLHPHGVFSYSHFYNFCTEATGFSEHFPGIRPHVVTLMYQFRAPFTRDIKLALGVRFSSKESINYILSKKGNAAGIVVGGAQEMLDTAPGTFTLYLKKRKGFIRLALMNGSSLVPVLSFGENDLYWILRSDDPGNILMKIQRSIIKALGFPLPVFFGRTLLPFVPLRKPINTVVGRPIHVEKVDNPSDEQINQLQERYIRELTELYEENKHKYNHAHIDLKIK